MTADRGTKRRVRRYTDGDKTTAIHAYVWEGSALAAERKTGIPHQRICEWVNASPELVDAEREGMRVAYRERLYAARQAYLEHMIDNVGDARIGEASGALRELSRCIDAVEGKPTERVEHTGDGATITIRYEDATKPEDAPEEPEEDE